VINLNQVTLKGESITVRLTSSLTGLEIYFALGALNFVLHTGTHL